MIKKGIIMSLSSAYAVVLEKGGTFHHIQLKEQMAIGQAILFTDEDILAPSTSIVQQLRPLLALAAALILILIPTFYATQSPYAVVSLDINPSIELLLTKEGSVKKVIAQNADATTLDLKTLKGQPLDVALSQLNEELVSKDFVVSSPYILVSYADLRSNSLDLSTQLKSYVEGSFKDAHIVYLASDKQAYKLATQEQLSLGRYSAREILAEQALDIDFKEVDITQLISYLESVAHPNGGDLDDTTFASDDDSFGDEDLDDEDSDSDKDDADDDDSDSNKDDANDDDSDSDKDDANDDDSDSDKDDEDDKDSHSDNDDEDDKDSHSDNDDEDDKDSDSDKDDDDRDLDSDKDDDEDKDSGSDKDDDDDKDSDSDKDDDDKDSHSDKDDKDDDSDNDDQDDHSDSDQDDED